MNVPIWIWYLIAGIIALFMLANIVADVLGDRRFRRMDRDFNEQRERVRRNLCSRARR
jgi:hypothetical protein